MYNFSRANSYTVYKLRETETSLKAQVEQTESLRADLKSTREQLEAARAAIEAQPNREALRRILPPGGARNAVDCALWELEAARAGRPVWALAGMAEPPRALVTTFTLGADTPEAMAEGARRYAEARSIKGWSAPGSSTPIIR